MGTIEEVTCADHPSLEPEKPEFLQVDPDVEYPEPLSSLDNVIVVEGVLVNQDRYDLEEEIAIPPTGTCTHICGQGPEARVCKAMIPIQRLKELADKDDIGELVTYRCSECASCQRCKESPRMKARSRREEIEQDPSKRVGQHKPFSHQTCPELSSQ